MPKGSSKAFRALNSSSLRLPNTVASTYSAHDQRHTRAGVDWTCCRQRTTVHPFQPLHTRVPILPPYFRLYLRSECWDLPGLDGSTFFKSAHHCVFADLENSRCITDATTINGHIHHLLLDNRLARLIAVCRHERFSCTIRILTPITLCTLCTSAWLHNLVAATSRAGNLLITDHGVLYGYNYIFGPLPKFSTRTVKD
jgi:hypothetical protein